MTQPLLKTGALLAVLSMAGCTMKSQEAPSLSGPSEYGTSLAIAIAPDVLSQDGASQSLVTITARDGNGAALRNVSLRAEIMVAGVRADFGSLSARNLVTGSDGRASLVYTAPAAPRISVDNGTVVNIEITPVGNDFNNSSARTASIRLVPPGVVVPPDGLQPSFTFTPTTPTDNQTVLFDASGSTAGPGNAIASYTWDFGDGGRGTGVTVAHGYASQGTYVVSLTITDTVGRSARKSETLSVLPGLVPTALFTSSPAEPSPGQVVHFNASQSRPSPGQSITSYRWDFGDGSFGDGVIQTHRYENAGTYRVLLTVTDSTGKQVTSVGDVKVATPAPPK